MTGRVIEASSSDDTVREYVWLNDMPLADVADVDTITPKLWFVLAKVQARWATITGGRRRRRSGE